MPPVAETAVPTSRPHASTARRWVAVAALSVLVHVVLLDALPRWTVATPDRFEDAPLRATLMPAVAPSSPPAAAPAPVPPRPGPAPASRAAPMPRRAPRIAPPDFVPESMEPIPEIAVGDGATSAPIAAGGPASLPAAGATPDPTPSAPSPAPSPDPTAAAPAPPPAKAPESARLDYKVVSIDTKRADPVRYYGVGTIDWTIVDDRYRADLVAAVDFLIAKIDVLVSHSEGAVVPSGLAPDRYTETPRRRATVATNFNRDDRRSVTFSASSASAPLLPGTQDRLSVLFQIGALLQAADAASPGALPQAIELPVAGVRGDVAAWRFDVIGPEAIEAAGATLATVHLRRAPRPGSNDRTIDVWVATQNGGYPARVLYTEPNGSTIEMTLSGIRAVAA